MSNLSPLGKLQQLQQLLPGQKLTPERLEAWKTEALQDHKLDKDEAAFLLDQIKTQNVSDEAFPAVTELLQTGYSSHTANPVARIGGHELPLHRVADDFTLETARSITDTNGIDEVYFKGEDNKLYVAYGDTAAKGSLDLSRIKQNYITRVDGKKFTVVHLNNETNTTWEGAKAPWVSTAKTLKDAGQNGIVKGIGEMTTAVTAMFIGKTVLDNGIKHVTTKAAGEAATQVGAKVAETAGVGLIDTAKGLSSSIGSSIKSSLRSVAVGGAVAGIVVGTVVGVGSAIGAVKVQFNDRDYTSLDMITGNY